MAEYGVDGAMIATAAETNSSCFRPKSEGGLAPWREVVELYIKTAMEVENRWGNTKYLLGHLIPGKDPIYRNITASKSYSSVSEVLGLPLMVLAQEVDKKLEIRVEGKSAGEGSQKKQLVLTSSGGVKRKRSIEIDDGALREMEVPHTTIVV
jgi:tRNA-dihydrouridine synthase 2